MGEPVEQCCCHLYITEDLRPFTEAKVGRDDDAGAFIELAQKVEQLRAAAWSGNENGTEPTAT